MSRTLTLPIVGRDVATAAVENVARNNPAAPPKQPFRIYQIELTGECNMQCGYCPHPRMQRKQGAMSAEILEACIQRVVKQGSYCLVLHHFGEPLLHPELRARLTQVAAAGLPMMMSTNALLLDDCWDVLLSIPTKIYVRISVHQWVHEPESNYFDVVKRWRKRAKGTNIRIADAGNFSQGRYVFHDWTQGVNHGWDATECVFIRENLGVVLWNGDIATCCADHEGATARLNVLDPDCDSRVSKLWSACATCDVGKNLRALPWDPATLTRLDVEAP
jgi:organic radical activating enzyme